MGWETCRKSSMSFCEGVASPLLEQEMQKPHLRKGHARSLEGVVRPPVHVAVDAREQVADRFSLRRHSLTSPKNM